VPKPSHLRSVNPTPAHAAQGAASHPSGVSVETVPKPLRSLDPTPAPAAQDAACRPGGVSVEAVAPSLGSAASAPAPATQGAARRPSGVSAEAVAPPLGSAASAPIPAVQGAVSRSSGVSVEVLPKSGRRRSFSAAEKLRMVREAAACTVRGDVEALLRREGIYSSHLAAWRKELALHGHEALAGHKRGPKPKLDAKDRRIAELEKQALRLEAKLSLAEKLIELQKNHPGLRPTCRREALCATLATGSEGAAGNFLAISIP
jgi:transposase